MEDMNVRANEVEEIETTTEVEETSDSSNAGALLAGIVGGFIAYAFIEGAKKLRVIAVEKWQAKKLAETNTAPVEAPKPEPKEAEAESEEEDPEV